MLSFIHKILAHCASGIRRNILQRACLGSSRRHYHGVFHCSVSGKCFYQRSHCGSLLSDGNIDTDHVLAFLVNDRIYCQRCFSGLTVADDQLSLASSNRNHGINGLNSCLQWFMYRTSFADSRRRTFNSPKFFCYNRSRSVNRLSQSIDHAADHGVSHRNRHYLSGTFHCLAFTNALPGSK